MIFWASAEEIASAEPLHVGDGGGGGAVDEGGAADELEGAEAELDGGLVVLFMDDEGGAVLASPVLVEFLVVLVLVMNPLELLPVELSAVEDEPPELTALEEQDPPFCRF